MIMPISFFSTSTKLLIRYGVALSVFFLFVITTLSFIPVTQEPAVNNIDKIEHLIAYTALTFPIALSYHPRYKAIFWGACIWGMMIEIIQPYVGRQADAIDATINAVGAGMGLLMANRFFTALDKDPLQFDE